MGATLLNSSATTVSVCMRDKYGWHSYIYKSVTIWFKGHLFNEVESKLRLRIAEYIENNFDCIQEKFFHQLVSSLRGNFAIVVITDKCVFMSVDKVRSIPLFYIENQHNFSIGNYAPLLKEKSSLISENIDMQASLEIAMSGYSVGRKTLYTNLFQLTAGEFLFFKKNKKIKRKYYYTYAPWKVHDTSDKTLKKEFTESIISSLQDVIKKSKGRQIAIPLSAGNDSRLIASGLKYLGKKNVLCFAYGRKDNFEAKASKAIADKLGFDWHHVELTTKKVRDYFTADKYKNFLDDFDGYYGISFGREIAVVDILKSNSIVSKDAIFVNGMSGDFISGAHIPSQITAFKKSDYSYDELLELSFIQFINKHFGLWKSLLSHNNYSKIVNELMLLSKDRKIPMHNKHIHGIFEAIEAIERQSKYVIKGQEVYDYHGFDWMLPLWSEQMLNFWEKVPLQYKKNQSLYTKCLIENNWGGVWKDIPINKKKIDMIWLSFIRLFFKGLLAPLGKKKWHQFEKNTFYYWMDTTRRSSTFPYLKVLFDRRGQRNYISWESEKYLNSHGIKFSSLGLKK